MLFNANYDGEYIFAFDNIADYKLIQRKLEMIRRYTDKRIMFYVLSGFESTDVVDIESIFKRIDLLMKYKCLPYIMRYQNKNETPWKQSEMRGMYISLARWCNQPSLFKRKSFREYSQMKGNGCPIPALSSGRKCRENCRRICISLSAGDSHYCSRRTDYWTFYKECEKIYGTGTESSRSLRRK